MVRRTKNKNIKQIKKKNNIFRFSAISLLVIFSFFTLPSINIFLDKNYIDQILEDGATKAQDISSKKVKKIKEIVGF